jgi:hypothetical protein
VRWWGGGGRAPGRRAPPPLGQAGAFLAGERFGEAGAAVS